MSTPSITLRQIAASRGQPAGVPAERSGLRGAGRGAGLDEVKTQLPQEKRVCRLDRTQDVGAQAAVAGARFDQVAGVWG